MEYRLNKIDTDIRKKINEEIKSDKIHANEKIDIKKDKKEHDKENKDINNCEKAINQKRYISIDGMKSLADTFNVEVEKLDILSADNSSGKILDMKK
ncbi:hypothetical protein [Clostridium butyricum]|uniref:hypothetical protein n=1 Tax=Clostridium butyricum TaxID=1492 RepID=UPI00168BFC84|nr:hypothetical protein [Clostridium butyricum]MDB2153559.1 hypothetical protein [Clostridium butyricum]